MLKDNRELISLLKHGKADEVQRLINGECKEAYPADFSEFMTQMISEKKVSRKDVAIKSGLSQDYLYKLLRGDKKTDERDYILAMCIVLKLNIAQTQHALSIYGMPRLSTRDPRSHIIYLCIEDKMSIDQIDEILEKNGHYLIKVNPEMPSAKITFIDEPLTPVANTPHVLHEYEEIDRIMEAEKCGLAPMDYTYWGKIIVQDENGSKYYVEAAFGSEFENYTVLDEENYKLFEKSCEKDADDIFYNIEPLEQYEKLIDARNSDFFKFFLEIDSGTDKKVKEVLSNIDDTRNYGVRYGAKLGNKGLIKYMEAFDTQNPAERRYYQIVENGDEITYSASHESYFLRIEMEDFYNAYYDAERDPEYYFVCNDRQELREKDVALCFVFDELLLSMHKYFAEESIEDKTTEGMDIREEEINALMQRAVALNWQRKYDEAAPILEECLNHFVEENEIEAVACTLYKLFVTYSNLGNDGKAERCLKKLLGTKDEIKERIGRGEEISGGALAAGEAALICAQKVQNECGEKDEKAKELILDALNLVEGRCETVEHWKILYQIYQKYAFIIDSDTPDEAIEYTSKAIAICRDQHFDSDPKMQMSIVTLYNNHAWVLWNELGSEEAIIYYGRCIELLEGYLSQGSQPESEVKRMLEHVGHALAELYKATNKENEEKRLKKRLITAGIEIN